MTCRTCAKEVPESSRFCLSCGSALSSNGGAAPSVTQTVAALTAGGPTPTPGRTPSHSLLSSSSGTLAEGRFVPGALLAGRYRIVALLGRGGMGEVYRAHDLTLGQEVALKFLPEVAARNPAALARFYSEVRIARQVSHANVCRVYDLGEVDGQPYLSMEYVDGEDLGSLLRRIGHLPSDKAIEIARQLCAGVAAAHAKGVLHRDLKPANVMLNGRGHVVVTDFGLAALADEIPGEEIRNGTPAYMAPEQLAGREVTVQSDIYSLGLVLYEVFTGKRAFEASTLAELVRLHSETSPVSPSTLVKELDPAVESAILRCLDPEPSNRPSSALAVAARLPGGDPLAAALAAGETPSPQMVAASGDTAALPWKIAVPTLAVALAGLTAFVFLASSFSMIEKAQLTKSPEVLADKARDLIRGLGYLSPPGDSAYALEDNTDFVNAVEKSDQPRPDWDQIARSRPSPLKFWYRQSLEPMLAHGMNTEMLIPGAIQEDDPKPTMSGMIDVQLDPQGRLTYFEALPPEKENPPETNSATGLEHRYSPPRAWTYPNSNREPRVGAARRVRRAPGLDRPMAGIQKPAAARGGLCLAWPSRLFFIDWPVESIVPHALDQTGRGQRIVARILVDHRASAANPGLRFPGALEFRAWQGRPPGRDARGHADVFAPHGALGISNSLLFRGKLLYLLFIAISAALLWGGPCGCCIWRLNRMFAAIGRRPSFPGRVSSTDAGATH